MACLELFTMNFYVNSTGALIQLISCLKSEPSTVQSSKTRFREETVSSVSPYQPGVRGKQRIPKSTGLQLAIFECRLKYQISNIQQFLFSHFIGCIIH